MASFQPKRPPSSCLRTRPRSLHQCAATHHSVILHPDSSSSRRSKIPTNAKRAYPTTKPRQHSRAPSARPRRCQRPAPASARSRRPSPQRRTTSCSRCGRQRQCRRQQRSPPHHHESSLDFRQALLRYLHVYRTRHVVPMGLYLCRCARCCYAFYHSF